MANIIRTGGGGKPEQRKSATFTQNGVYTVNPDSGYALSAADILVNVASPTPVMQSKTVTPTGSQFTVSPDAGYSGLSSVTVNGDEDLVASNIKEGVNIYGVTGTYAGGAYDITSADNPDGTQNLAIVDAGGGSSSGSCTVVVHAQSGSTVTLTKGSTTMTATEVSGTWTFNVTESGTWTVTVVSGGSTFTEDATVEVRKDISFAPKATVTGLGSQDTSLVIITKQYGFPSSFEEWTDANNNIFVKIPTMYRKVTSVVDGQITGFIISTAQADSDYHPYSCFVAPDGETVLPYVCIGKYCSTSDSVMNSVNGTPVDQDIRNARTNARALGTGYQQYDWQFQKLFTDLALANYGNVDFNNGRLIENYLGVYNLNKEIFVDGVSVSGDWYFAKNPDNYVNSAGSSSQGYQRAGYSAPSSSGFVTKLGYDANGEFFNLPNAAAGSSYTYYCDKFWYGSGNSPLRSCVGVENSNNGLWFCLANNNWATTYYARLCYRPISA